jgi:hypothetical protein
VSVSDPWEDAGFGEDDWHAESVEKDVEEEELLDDEELDDESDLGDVAELDDDGDEQ